MINKNQAIAIIETYIAQSQDENKIIKCKEMLTKLNSMLDIEFNKVAKQTLGEEPNLSTFNDWLMSRLQEVELRGTEFVELNDMVSYNLVGRTQNTIALHVVPKHVTTTQVRDSGTYLVDALEQLKTKMKDGEFPTVNTIFAVSDILKLKVLQGYFKNLGFDVKEGDEAFRKKFKNPYQASLSKDALLSDEWEKLKEDFMKYRPTIEELQNEESKDI